MADPNTLAALRTLVSASKLPNWQRGGGVATGVDPIDDALGGGLPAGRLTELVCRPGTGGQSVVAAILSNTRELRQRVALVDASDGFSPEEYEPDHLRHLVWARARGLRDALVVADILVRDGNYSVLILDLRDVATSDFNRTQKSVWHRLHRVAERQPAAVLIQTSQDSIPAVRWRLSLPNAWGLKQLKRPRVSLIADMPVSTTRGLQEVLKTA